MIVSKLSSQTINLKFVELLFFPAKLI